MVEGRRRAAGWILAGLVALVFAGSATGKLTADPDALKVAEGFGIDARTYAVLGVVELACLILFLFPRTGVAGTLLLASYMGGAIATHVGNGVPIFAPAAVEAFVLAAAFVRFPELGARLINAKP